MELSTEFWIQIMVYAVTFGTTIGTVTIRLKYLEKKMDKYNNLQERMIKVEQSAKSAHHRLDEMHDNNKSNNNDSR